ncbi:TonB-dependent receptor plug domain-containing protein [Niabella sp. W65]|nr:TonB-dependent receptor plug domain-containing protein [Niabella sp. W65]MCH7368917.1 TonB-dependent receptor plug domain-containing protein [Niabella sp. W65]
MYLSKMPLLNLENPQVYNVISKDLMKEQVVVTFDDALKNAPGVNRLWSSTGRPGDGAGYFSMRGFSVQPTMINGCPDSPTEV